MSDKKEDKFSPDLNFHNKNEEEVENLTFYSKDGKFYQKTDDDEWVEVTALSEGEEKQ
ncbi:MAG: hypothetical protein RIG61_01030 [Deltaproteobacteria bacterium]